MKVTPIRDQILVKRNNPVEMSPGGLVLPASAQSKNNEAIVVACGRGKVTDSGKLIETTVKVDDTVLLNSWENGTEVVVEGVEHLLVSEDSILAILG